MTPEPAPLAEEAARLAEVVLDRARQALGQLRAVVAATAGPPDEAAPGPATRAAGHPPECRWCPVCQLVAAARGERVDLPDRLGSALAAVTDTVLSTVDSLARQARSAAAPAAGPPPPAADRPPAGRVQPIDLDE